MTVSTSLPIALFGAAALVATPFHAALGLSLHEVQTIARAVTVRIEGQNPGSGVLIEKNGNTYTVLTAAHVVETEDEYDIFTPDQQRYPLDFKQVQKFPNVDLALVTFESHQTYSVVEMGDATAAIAGSSIFVAGFSASNQSVADRGINVTDGKITANAKRPLADGYALVYSNETISGMSGGAVLSEDGHLIGIHGRADAEQETGLTETIYLKTGFNLGIPINTFLSLRGIGASVSPTSNAVWTADDWFLQAGDALKKQKYQAAIMAYDRAIQLNPRYIDAYYNRGIAQAKDGNISGAIADYNRVVQLDPNDALVYYNRANAQRRLGNDQSAIADYDRVISLKPDFAPAFNNRGATRHNQGDISGAIADYNTALRLNPDHANAHYNRGNARFALGERDRAIVDYDRAIQLNPSYAAAFYNRGHVRSQLGDKQGAIADMTKAANLFRDDNQTKLADHALQQIKQLSR